MWLDPAAKVGRSSVRREEHSPSQLRRNLAEPFQRRFKVLDDLRCHLVWRGQAVGVDVAVVLQPEDIEVQLVPRRQFLIAEPAEAFAVLPRVALVVGAVGGDEVVKVGTA